MGKSNRHHFLWFAISDFVSADQHLVQRGRWALRSQYQPVEDNYRYLAVSSTNFPFKHRRLLAPASFASESIVVLRFRRESQRPENCPDRLRLKRTQDQAGLRPRQALTQLVIPFKRLLQHFAPIKSREIDAPQSASTGESHSASPSCCQNGLSLRLGIVTV